MIELRLASGRTPQVLAVVVRPSERDRAAPGSLEQEGTDAGLAKAAGAPGEAGVIDPGPLARSALAELAVFLREVEHPGAAATVHTLPRPGRKPHTVLAVGVGEGTAAEWRSAGAALVRASRRWSSVHLRLPDGAVDVPALAEGALLASYRFSLASGEPGKAPKLNTVFVEALDDRTRPSVREGLTTATRLAEAVALARDLTNAPSLRKSPRWLAGQMVSAAASRPGVTVRVLDETELDRAGFGGILAVGGGSARPPRLVQIGWRPRGARTHVALVGKGITFDSGGISIKQPPAMRLMRKDMAGAAVVCATVLAAADLRLPVRVTALAPLAENMISGSALRPGDVVRHYGGQTTEVLNTDAEGRLVLADALAYAARRVRPDLLVDIATLTAATGVALGKRTAGLFSHNDDLALALEAAGADVGEAMWRMPLAEVYRPSIASELADLRNVSVPPEAGGLIAALFLREFTGALRDRWAHIDMSSPAWSDAQDGPLVKGASGWGVRALVRWLATV